jgi:hypothetical protein
MTDEQEAVSEAHDAFLDAAAEASLHDRNEETPTLQQHVADILRSEGFTVNDGSIDISPDFHSGSAKFIIKGREVEVTF